MSAEHSIAAVYGDSAASLIRVDAAARYTNLHINWATQLQDGFGTFRANGIESSAPDTSIAIDYLKMNGMRGGFAYMTGADQS